MMKINILPIVSALHKTKTINEETKKLLDEIESLGDFRFHLSELPEFYDTDISLILVQSGGSEGYFLEMEKQLKAPYYLLTYGSNNSLAASMEILSYLKAKGQKAEILHGSAKYIAKRLGELKPSQKEEPVNLGVIGKPSDWLIASNVNYDDVLDRFNIRLIDISIDELVEIYESIDADGYEPDLKLIFDKAEVDKAKRVSKALDLLVEKYNLKGLTIRCFDLLGRIHTTGCLGLSLLNSKHIIGTCEGDIPTMLSMYLMQRQTGQPGFMANPSRIDVEKNEIVFAHCTVPLSMVESYETMTHYESGIGVAFRGKMKEADVTIFKLSNNLKDYYLAPGKIVENLEEDNLCRTQIRIKLDDVSYFLNEPYGNHHVIAYGCLSSNMIE